MNTTTMIFAVNCMGAIDKLRRIEGEPSVVEEFMTAQGLPTYSTTKDHKGRTFMTDRKTGKVTKLGKKFPKYLQPVNKISKP